MELNQYQKEMQHLLQLQDQRVNRQLYNLYVDIVKELKKSLLAEYQSYENLSRSKKMDLKRMSAMLEAIDSQSQKLKTGLNGTIPDHLERVGKMAYNELFYEYEQTRSAIQFALLPEEELKTIIETPVAGLRLSQRINDGVVSDLRKSIKSELTRSFVHGLSYQRTAKRLSELGSSSYRRALNITRTEAGRVSAIARQRSQKEAVDLGIEFKKMWVATLDKRTRNTHQHLDGQQVGPEEYFEHNGLRTLQPHMFGIASEDCNCRCRTISRLKDDDTPLLRRDSETGEVVEYRNYREWENKKLSSVEVDTSPKPYDFIDLSNPENQTIENFEIILSRAKVAVEEYKKHTGIDLVSEFNNKNFRSMSNPYDDNKAKFLKFLYNKIGYDAKPQKLSDTKGYNLFYRGITGSKETGLTAKDFYNRLVDGEYDFSGAMSSMVGRGIYFSIEQRMGQVYAKNGILAEMYFPKNAKVIDDQVLKSFRNAFSNEQLSNPELAAINDLINYDIGPKINVAGDRHFDFWAIFSGHDAVQRDNYEILAVYNRGVLGVKDND
ncbi:phage minor head protein [Streptococcus suis]|uniref:phage minor head protein n=2 Tax=Streptococcus suis TaxID=1307 RepID=UPI0006AD01F7|nr:phage minor head protein [Streptococcus suis]